MKMSRSGFLKSKGFEMVNTYWSWCAINEKEKQVVVTLWDDYNGVILARDWQRKANGDFHPGYDDVLKKLDLVSYHGYELLVLKIYAKDPSITQPRKMDHFDKELIPAELVRKAGTYSVILQ